MISEPMIPWAVCRQEPLPKAVTERNLYLFVPAKCFELAGALELCL